MAKGDEIWRTEDGAIVESTSGGTDVKNRRNVARNVSQFTRPCTRPTDHEAGRSILRHDEEVVSPIVYYASKDLGGLNEEFKGNASLVRSGIWAYRDDWDGKVTGYELVPWC